MDNLRPFNLYVEFVDIDRVKKREKDREELWQKLDDLRVVAGSSVVVAGTATGPTLNSKSPPSQQTT